MSEAGRPELSTCPMCGESAGLVPWIQGTGEKYWAVQCTDCSLRTRWHKTQDGAVKAWNRREGGVEVECEVVPDNSIPSFGGYDGMEEGKPFIMLNLNLLTQFCAVKNLPFKWLFAETLAHEVFHAAEDLFDEKFDHERIHQKMTEIRQAAIEAGSDEVEDIDLEDWEHEPCDDKEASDE